MRAARAANVAAACRAMKNMGLARLRLVEPVPDLSDRRARSLAHGAWDVLDAATRHASLAEAVAGASFVAGTCGRPDVGAWTPQRLAGELASRAGGGAAAIVFGPESTGLSRRELAFCHETVQIPADAAQPSLNLAQAVLLVAYELRTATAPAAAPAPVRAASGDVEAALASLERGLLGIGYLNTQNPRKVLSELRRLLFRAGPTPREARLLRGLGRQLEWAAGQLQRLRGPR